MNSTPIQTMNTLTYWNPLHELFQLRNHAPRVLRPSDQGDGSNASPHTAPQWVPVLDLSEDDAHYLVQLELPGVEMEDVEVTLEDGALLISGERRIETGERRVHRSERCFGRFSRKLLIPDDADADQIEARFRNGVLQIDVAKHEARKPRRIQVLAN